MNEPLQHEFFAERLERERRYEEQLRASAILNDSLLEVMCHPMPPPPPKDKDADYGCVAAVILFLGLFGVAYYLLVYP